MKTWFKLGVKVSVLKLNVSQCNDHWRLFLCFQALILAMGFHEKGRSLMKRKQHDNAVCHLLKADEQFRYKHLTSSGVEASSSLKITIRQSKQELALNHTG